MAQWVKALVCWHDAHSLIPDPKIGGERRVVL